MIDLWESLFRTVSALAVVLVLMGVAALAVRRLMGHRLGITGGRPLVQVLASGYIAPRKTVSLVSVAGEYLIIGTTATDLVPLGRVSDSAQLRELLASPIQNPSTESPAPQSVLASWLRRLPLSSFNHDKGIHG
ncbi:MAG: flagellar biosynthetic protein FliO [Nitrospira sp.]|nr:flagellar biosynthetic protein FliO [Nitrospira sp. BO4]